MPTTLTFTHISVDAAKSAAKALRAQCLLNGEDISHSAALERVSHAAGRRDWNTYAATLKALAYPLSLRENQRIMGHYLGHAFTGTLTRAEPVFPQGWQSIMVQLDEPVDVVQSAHFTGLRQRISARLGPNLQTTEKLGDGTPHMVLEKVAL